MKSVKTVEDLRNALSMYDGSLPLEFSMINPGGQQTEVKLNNVTQIAEVVDEKYNPKSLLIILLS